MKRILLIATILIFQTLYITASTNEEMKFYDVKKQTQEFIEYYNSIKLTSDQQKLKDEALSKVPAPCCSNFSIATCCCPCNLAKATWGLAHYLIVEKNYKSEELTRAVTDWIQFTHKNGFEGDGCFKSRCSAPFHKDGCGGMNEKEVVF